MANIMTTTLGEALRQQRDTLGFSQRQAADAIGVSQAAWQKWERGDSKPGIDRIEAVADFLNVSYEAVFELWKDAGVRQMTRARPQPNGTQDRLDALERELVAIRDMVIALRMELEAATVGD